MHLNKPLASFVEEEAILIQVLTELVHDLLVWAAAMRKVSSWMLQWRATNAPHPCSPLHLGCSRSCLFRMTFQTERRTLRSECCAAIFLFRLFGIVVFSQDRLTLTYKWDSMSGIPRTNSESFINKIINS